YGRRFSKGIDPGPERQDLFALVGAAAQDVGTASLAVTRERAKQSTLADPGLARHHHDAAVAPHGPVQRLAESSQFGVAADRCYVHELAHPGMNIRTIAL